MLLSQVLTSKEYIPSLLSYLLTVFSLLPVYQSCVFMTHFFLCWNKCVTTKWRSVTMQCLKKRSLLEPLQSCSCAVLLKALNSCVCSLLACVSDTARCTCQLSHLSPAWILLLTLDCILGILFYDGITYCKAHNFLEIKWGLCNISPFKKLLLLKYARILFNILLLSVLLGLLLEKLWKMSLNEINVFFPPSHDLALNFPEQQLSSVSVPVQRVGSDYDVCVCWWS